jgi:uncharacterized integral membrane protein
MHPPCMPCQDEWGNQNLNCLTYMHAATIISSLPSIIPESAPMLEQCMDFVAVMGSAGLGMSLKEIHIYVSPLKKALQLFWFLGLVGGIGIMVIQVIIDLITSLHPTYI